MSLLILFAAVFISGLAGLGLTRASKKHIRLLTAFSGAYLLGLSVLHLLPEVYLTAAGEAGYYILLGFLLQVFLEFFSGGIEHGHSHAHHGKPVPVAMLVSLCIHSFIEAMPLAADTHHAHAHVHDDLTRPLLTGIILHKIPVTIVLVIMLYQAGLSKIKLLGILLIFAAMAPLGGISAILMGAPDNPAFFNNMLAVVIGIFLHISTTILFEASEDHRFHIYKMSVILLGLLIAAAGS